MAFYGVLRLSTEPNDRTSYLLMYIIRPLVDLLTIMYVNILKDSVGFGCTM